MARRYILALVVVVGLLSTAAEAHQLLLCIHKNGNVTVRPACKATETAADPATLGLQGPPGPPGPAGPVGPPAECVCTTTTTTPTTTTTVPPTGHCAFQGRPCTSAADCALAGSCAPEGDCRQACPGGDGSVCSPAMSCFDAAVVGDVCVGCANNSSICPAQAPCVAPAGGPADDCAMPANPACPVGGPGGTPCVIPDACILP
jgi:hypothetical protein